MLNCWLPAKLKISETFGCSFLNPVAISSKDSVSDDAANINISALVDFDVKLIEQLIKAILKVTHMTTNVLDDILIRNSSDRLNTLLWRVLIPYQIECPVNIVS